MWTELEILTLSKVSQKEKYKYHMIPLQLWNLKYGTDDPIYKTETDHGQGRQTCGLWGGEGREWNGWGIWEFSGCQMLYLEWSGNGVPQYRKLCMTGHCAAQKKLKEHCESTLL